MVTLGGSNDRSTPMELGLHSKYKIDMTYKFKRKTCEEEYASKMNFEKWQVYYAKYNQTIIEKFNISNPSMTGFTGKDGPVEISLSLNWTGTTIVYKSYVKVLLPKIHAVIIGGAQKTMGKEIKIP